MPTSNTPQAAVVPRAKLWLEIDGNYVFGLGICNILEAVEQTGSIKSAATEVGKSYRHVWSRIKEVEHSLGVELVDAHVGGGDARRSSLTEPARQLVTRFREMRRQVFAIVEENFSADIEHIIRCARGD